MLKFSRISGGKKKLKKRGVLNQRLSSALAGLGHGDSFLLCDAVSKRCRARRPSVLGFPDMKQCLSGQFWMK